MEMGFDFKTGKRGAQGLVPIDGTIGSFGLVPTDPKQAPMIDAMKKPLAMMKGMKVSGGSRVSKTMIEVATPPTSRWSCRRTRRPRPRR